MYIYLRMLRQQHWLEIEKKGETILLKIDTELAQSKGAKFYIGNEKVWLSDYISPEFIKDN